MIAARGIPTLVLAASLASCGGMSYIVPHPQTDRAWRRVRPPRAQQAAPPAATSPPLPAAAPRGPAAATLTPLSARPIVAVFGIENRGTPIASEMLDRLTVYLAAQLAASGRYQVVPPTKLRKRLSRQKKGSYRTCYEQSCQIEIGRELAAQKTLSSSVMKLGSRCMVAITLYDLKKATTERAASAKGACDEDAVVATLEQVVGEL